MIEARLESTTFDDEIEEITNMINALMNKPPNQLLMARSAVNIISRVLDINGMNYKWIN